MCFLFRGQETQWYGARKEINCTICSKRHTKVKSVEQTTKSEAPQTSQWYCEYRSTNRVQSCALLYTILRVDIGKNSLRVFEVKIIRYFDVYTNRGAFSLYYLMNSIDYVFELLPPKSRATVQLIQLI